MAYLDRAGALSSRTRWFRLSDLESRAFHERANPDVLWFPWNGCSWLNFRSPAVATLHDATSFVIPDYETQTRIIFRNAAERCRALITDSVFSAHELARELAVPLERLTPIHLGVDMPELELPPLAVAQERPYVLFVGTAERRKGIDTLVHAMARVQRDKPHLRLVVAGALGGDLSEEQASAVKTLGFVDDEGSAHCIVAPTFLRFLRAMRDSACRYSRRWPMVFR